MTREEAVEKLHWFALDNRDLQIIDTAIEALTSQDLTEPNNTCKVDLISRQDALKPFCISPDGTRIPEVDCDNFPVEFSVGFIKKHLLSLPSAEQKKGHWIDDETNYTCSECYRGCWVNSDYCPWCGADMRCEEA